jgi:hypothetical protein
MRIGLLAGLVAVAVACAPGCGEGKKETAADAGAAPQTPPPVAGDEPGKTSRGGPQGETSPAPKRPIPVPPAGPGRPAPDKQPPPPGKQPNADGGEKLLKALEQMPVGIKVVHTPAKLKGHTHDGTQKHIDTRWLFYWGYQTTVSAVDAPLDVVLFGSCEWVDGKWAIPTNTDEYDVISGGGQQFSEWYMCPKARLETGKEYTDPQNWSGSKKLRAFKQKWFYVGVDKDGKRYKGEAEVELLGELDATPGKEDDKAKGKEKPPGK